MIIKIKFIKHNPINKYMGGDKNVLISSIVIDRAPIKAILTELESQIL